MSLAFLFISRTEWAWFGVMVGLAGGLLWVASVRAYKAAMDNPEAALKGVRMLQHVVKR